MSIHVRPPKTLDPAPAGAWMQTASGRAFDLLRPDVDQIDFRTDVAEALARIPRFTGHVSAGPYSVAQHCVMGADAVLKETGRADLAAAFLLHDAHEAYLGDIATPIIVAFDEVFFDIAERQVGDVSPALRPGAIVREVKTRLDAAIHFAAGLAWPPAPGIVEAVKEWDLRMLATERRLLLGAPPAPWHPAVEAAAPVRFGKPFSVWPWPLAADTWRARLARLCPDALSA